MLVGLGAPSLREALPVSRPPGGERPLVGGARGAGSQGPSTGFSITDFLIHTAGCGPLCYSRQGACLSASVLLLLITLAALITLIIIAGPPPRTPGQGGQERMGQTCWEQVGGTERWGKQDPAGLLHEMTFGQFLRVCK